MIRNTARCLKNLKKKTEFLKILGSYAKGFENGGKAGLTAEPA